MTEPAPVSPTYRAWRPARTNDMARPIYEPPPLTERRQCVRAGFDRAFVDALARRLGLASDALLEQVGGLRVAPASSGHRSRREAARAGQPMVIKENVPSGGTWLVTRAPQTSVGPVATVRGAPLTRTARALARSIGQRRGDDSAAPRDVRVHRADGRLVPDSAPAERPARVTGAAADQLYERYLLAERAEAVLGDPASVPTWFGAELGALGHTRPLEWLDTAAGRERLAEVLDAIAYGFPG